MLRRLSVLPVMIAITAIMWLAGFSSVARGETIDITGTVDISGGYTGDILGPIVPSLVNVSVGDVIYFTYTFDGYQKLQLLDVVDGSSSSVRVSAWLGEAVGTWGDFTVSDWSLELIGATSGSGTVPTSFSGIAQGHCCRHLGTESWLSLADGDFVEFYGVSTTFTVVSLPTEPTAYNSARTRFYANSISVHDGLVDIGIDIRPWSDINPVRLRARGVIPVAILGSDVFDVANVDVTTLAFGPGGAAPRHAVGGHVRDVNSDGLMDLLSHYPTRETGLANGDTEACVTGETFDGIPFEGCDMISTRPRPTRWR